MPKFSSQHASSYKYTQGEPYLNTRLQSESHFSLGFEEQLSHNSSLNLVFANLYCDFDLQALILGVFQDLFRQLLVHLPLDEFKTCVCKPLRNFRLVTMLFCSLPRLCYTHSKKYKQLLGWYIELKNLGVINQLLKYKT